MSSHFKKVLLCFAILVNVDLVLISCLHSRIVFRAKEEQIHRQAQVVSSSLNTSLASLLPSFVKGHGVIVFYHVAKTGGTTIRKSYGGVPNVKFHRHVCKKKINCTNVYHRTKVIVDKFITKGKKKKPVLFLEIHGGPPGLVNLADDLRHWRSLAKKFHVSFFAFTLVREPISFAVSYFKFFHNQCLLKHCEPQQYRVTEKSLLEATVPNRQCLLLSRMSATEWRRGYDSPPVTAQECNSVYDVMINELDWVGTMEEMSTHTLPLLDFMLTGKNSLSGSTRGRVQHNKSKKHGLASLSSLTVESIQNISRYDQGIYDRVQQDFQLSQFKNFGGADKASAAWNLGKVSFLWFLA